MNVYVYRAALYCAPCADDVKRSGGIAPKFGSPSTESCYWPQGPYADGGGEADTPQHCDTCSVFLENPLTDDGREYVQTEFDLAMTTLSVGNTVREWADFYGIAS